MSESLQDQARRLKSTVPVKRLGGRGAGEGRPFSIAPGFTTHAEGSVLVSAGDTRIICTASVEDRVPNFMRGQGKGWVTAEYGMLPRATHTRSQREVTAGRPGGRTSEIQRLIGRSLRSVVNLEALGEHTVWLDCDVIQADGSTRTAAISGAFVALVLALRTLGRTHTFATPPLLHHVAAVSVGMLGGEPLLDLDYAEDSNAEVDLNVVMTDALEVIELQGTAEGKTFTRSDLNVMLDCAEQGIAARVAAQKAVLDGRLV